MIVDHDENKLSSINSPAETDKVRQFVCLWYFLFALLPKRRPIRLLLFSHIIIHLSNQLHVTIYRLVLLAKVKSIQICINTMYCVVLSHIPFHT